MSNFFYYDTSGQKFGPVNESQLKALVAQGQINPQTPMETDTGYKGLAGQLPGLFVSAQNSAALKPFPSKFLVGGGVVLSVLFVVLAFAVINGRGGGTSGPAPEAWRTNTEKQPSADAVTTAEKTNVDAEKEKREQISNLRSQLYQINEEEKKLDFIISEMQSLRRRNQENDARMASQIRRVGGTPLPPMDDDYVGAAGDRTKKRELLQRRSEIESKLRMLGESP